MRVVDGTLRKGTKIRIMSTGRDVLVDRVGIFTPKRTDTAQLSAGEVGYVISGIKDVDGAPVGDTITESATPAARPLPGFRQVKPNVFAGLFPIDSND